MQLAKEEGASTQRASRRVTGGESRCDWGHARGFLFFRAFFRVRDGGGGFLREWREGDADREATRVVVTARVSQVLQHERDSGGRVRRRAGAAVLVVVRWCYY
jgi:hypothetical protein